MTEKPYVQLSAIEFQEVIKIYKENEQLKKENEQLKSKNRGLQSELQIFKEDVTHSNLQINKLADENEHIKNTIKEAYKTERTHIGKSVLKQLKEAIQ